MKRGGSEFIFRFIERAENWTEWFINKLKERSNHEWANHELDFYKYMDATYVLHVPKFTERKIMSSDRLSEQKIKSGKTLLDTVTWWNGFYGENHIDPSIHTPDFTYHYCWLTNPDPFQKFGHKEDDVIDIMRVEQMQNFIITASQAESNIAMGHVDILKDVVKKGHKAALIMEDDIIFGAGAMWLLESMFEEQLPHDWDLVYLSGQPCDWGFESEPHSRDLDRIYNGVYWMSGFIISQSGARKLLDNLPVIGPVDVWINHHFRDMKVYTTFKPYIGQDKTLRSYNRYSFADAILKENNNKDI